MNIPMDWIHEIINTNKMAIGDNKQVESVDIFFEPNYKGEECPPCGWNHMRFTYEPIGVEHKSWTKTHPERGE